MIVSVGNPRVFFGELGGLHDARLLRVDWRPSDGCVTVEVDDLCSNFVGLPEYKAKVPSLLTMERVAMVSVSADPCEEKTRIFDVEIEAEGSGYRLVWRFAPGGKLIVSCELLAVSLINREALPLAIKQSLI